MMIMTNPHQTLLSRLPRVRGELQADAPLADFIWFRSGGAADILFRPADIDDLQDFLVHCPPDIPLCTVGVGSNLLVRDGGVAGVVIRLSKNFANISIEQDVVQAGAAAMGITVAHAARDAALAGLEFLRGVPGTIGGAVRMNAGAYGREIADIFVSCDVMHRSGRIDTFTAGEMHYSYRHSGLNNDMIIIGARLRGTAGERAVIDAELTRISAEREASQPLRSRTGGSTFKNPPGHKAWQLIDQAGCRGLRLGGAQVSEKHTNFLINTGDASSADLEALGEEVRARVFATSGILLEWEIKRIGQPEGRAL